jgi:hypothetical protein
MKQPTPFFNERSYVGYPKNNTLLETEAFKELIGIEDRCPELRDFIKLVDDMIPKIKGCTPR